MAKAKKFGAFSGVFTPSILTILGVIMFLRLPWIVGQAGLWSTLGIILVAHIISASTGLSVASVATDKRVGTGGSYFIISRSLGLPIGGTLGLALFVGLSFSVSLYLIGFAETFLSYFGFEVTINTIRLAGSVILFLVAAVTFISTSLAIKTQYLIMMAMVLSLLSVFLGRHGFTTAQPLLEPMGGALPWIALFAIFFPAVTGFEAGVSMSGDLKDPRRQIPFGTIAAIAVGLFVYVGLALFFSFTVDRELLVGDPRVLFRISWLPQLVIAGILGATLSSALGSILGAPRILQAVAIDRILPPFFAKGFGPSNEPRNALLLTYAIAQAGILIGELNAIARIVTIFFIITYGFLNITYAVESWAGSDFRPSFKIPRFVSIIGAIACIVVMIQLDIFALIIASIALIGLFLFLKRKELTLQSDDTWNSIWASLVKTGLGRLSYNARKARNWRPNVILFSGGEKNRPHLVEMGKALVGKLGIFTNFELVEDPSGQQAYKRLQDPVFEKPSGKPGVFTRKHHCKDVYEGIDFISRVYGFPGYEPNTILMGWASKSKKPEKFAQLLSKLTDQDYNVALLHYDKQAGFGECRTIDFWWTGRGRVLSLALSLIKFITSSKEWRGARFRILVINNQNHLSEQLYGLINQVLDNERILAEIRVINNGVEQLSDADIIHAESRKTDLTILELPDLIKGQAAEAVELITHTLPPLKTSLLLHASTEFDEIGLITDAIDLPEKEAFPISRPLPGIVQGMKPASAELLNIELQHIARKGEKSIRHLLDSGFEPLADKQAVFFASMDVFVSKTFGNLMRALEMGSPAEQSRALLRVLNDFSYHSQKQVQYLSDEMIPWQKELLHRSLTHFNMEIRTSLYATPESVKLMLPKKSFIREQADSPRVWFYKTGKKLTATIFAREVPHKILLQAATRYFLVYRRLQDITALMTDFLAHSNSQLSEVRKLLTDIHELIERARQKQSPASRTLDAIRMEKDRLKAKVAVLQDKNRNFFYAGIENMYGKLLSDMDDMTDHLESIRSNMLSSNFKAYNKKSDDLAFDLEGFPVLWQRNTTLLIARGLLDFSLISLRSRISSKIQKHHQEMMQGIEKELLSVIGSFSQIARREKLGADEVIVDGKLDYSLLRTPAIIEGYAPLFEEIRELLKDLPEKMEIGGDQIAEQTSKDAFFEAPSITVEVRRTVSYYVGSDLIDYVNSRAADVERNLDVLLHDLKDQARLVNFSYHVDLDKIEDTDPELNKQEQMQLLHQFESRLRTVESQINDNIQALSTAFQQGLKAAFDPLSSATIGLGGGTSKRKRKIRGRTYAGRILSDTMESASERIQRELVNLLYSRSEGVIWFRRISRKEHSGSSAIAGMIGLVNATTPKQEILSELPFYYRTLFSGQSGTGDDFWVGMDNQLALCNNAVEMHRKGFSGALIITGLRSSGKSSLSKKVAGMHFSADRIFNLRAPKGCAADPTVFSQKLTETLRAPGASIDEAFLAIPEQSVVIIQDLGLWWERKPGGDAVIELIKQLIDRYGSRCLFLININTHALRMLDHWCNLSRYALQTISCEPFGARDLEKLILLRHHAGGMQYVFNKREESRMTALDRARLFNSLFEQSFGNPGTAMNIWLSSITRIQAKTIYLELPEMPSAEVFDGITTDQWFYIAQFIMHRRFSIGRLAENLERHPARVHADIRDLVRTGILIEKFDGIYAIRSGLDLLLINKLKNINQK